jgi:gliding motility-associated-like protein
MPATLSEIPFESRLFCPVYLSGCDLLKLDGPSVVCRPGDTILYTLHRDPTCAEPVTWTFDQQSVTGVDSNQYGRSFRFEMPGEYILKVSKSSCNDVVDSMIVSVGNYLPKINLPRDTVLCMGSTMILDPGIGYADYLWQDGSGNESISVSEKGLYWVQLTGKNGCISRDTTNIRSVESLPVSFLPSDTIICAGEPWEIHPLASFNSYVWSTGETSGSIVVSNAGLYSLQVVDRNGCMGKDSLRVETKKCPFGIYFPNAFTPNRDGLNDIFRPVIIGRPVIYKLSIYNRWGQQIFETTDPAHGWNGTIKNTDQESGSYIWTCTYQFNTQEKMIRKGVFLLLR